MFYTYKRTGATTILWGTGMSTRTCTSFLSRKPNIILTSNKVNGYETVNKYTDRVPVPFRNEFLVRKIYSVRKPRIVG